MIQFHADYIKVNERESDHSYKVQLNVGEYEQDIMAQLVALPKDKNYKITVETEDE